MKIAHENKLWFSVFQAIILIDDKWYSFEGRRETKFPMRNFATYVSACHNPIRGEYNTPLGPIVRKNQLTFSNFEIINYKEFTQCQAAESLEYLRLLCDDPKYISLYDKSRIVSR